MGNRFQVGDRVALVEDYGRRLAGSQGVVSAVEHDGACLTTLKMDDDGGAAGRCCMVYARRLKLVEGPQSNEDSTIHLVVATADRIFPRRSYDTILKSLMEEMGELSTEIAIAQGTKKREASPDGIKGEAIDVFVVAVDMLRQAWGKKLFTREFTAAVTAKLNKWEGK